MSKTTAKTLSYWQNEVTREWYWNLKANNGKIIAIGGEGYKRLPTMLSTVYSLFPRLQSGTDSNMKLVRVQSHQAPAPLAKRAKWLPSQGTDVQNWDHFTGRG